MATKGLWSGEWDGLWQGYLAGGPPPPGFIFGASSSSSYATGTLSTQISETLGGKKRKKKSTYVEDWYAEQERKINQEDQLVTELLVSLVTGGFFNVYA